MKQGDLGITGRAAVGTAVPWTQLTVVGGLGGNVGFVPSYAAWNAYGVGDGGAAIYNDNGTYKKLMVVGNSSAGGSREVGIWDNLTVTGKVTATQYCIGASCVSSWPTGGIASEADTLQSVTNRGNSTTNNIVITNTSPTLYLADTDNRSAMIHNNSNLLYVLRGCSNGSTGWCAYNGVWPMVINLENNDAAFGGAVSATTNLSAPEVYANNWFRVNGGGGIYWQAYGSGLNMSDGTWIRSYGGAGLWMNSANIGTNGCLTIGFGGGGCAAGAGQFSGTVTASAFLYASDRTLKENIAPLEDSVNKLSHITGVSFTWRPGTPKAGQSDIGVIAQDVEKVVPEAVHTDDTGAKSVDYARLVPLLISAMNEQQREIDALKARVAELTEGK